MGLFSRQPNLEGTFADPGEVIVDPQIMDALPDPGSFLLTCLLSDLPDSTIEEASAEISRVRNPNGGLPSALRSKIPFKPSSGPLYLLNWICAGDFIPLQVWASQGLRFGPKRDVEVVVATLITNQGVPAAATWVHTQRGSDVLPIDFLAQQLQNSYEERASSITNGMVIDSFRKWKR